MRVLAQDESFCNFDVRENLYRTVANPYYWQHRKPYEGYWQQDIHYKIAANIDETKDIIDGEMIVTYWNNSPDNLSYLYFHLYQNAFQPGSYADKLAEVNHQKNNFGKYENDKKGTEIEYIQLSSDDAIYDGLSLKPIIDNTIMRVDLPTPLLSNNKITLKIKFNTYFDSGSMRRRMKKFDASGNTHYDGVHWYPRISVYDKKNAWDTNQHLGKEFYGDYGTYDVQLTFSDNYIVEATGDLINENEVMPDDLKSKIDMRRFANKPWNEPSSVIIPYRRSARKTWQYHAENVHDFAFTADPTYRIMKQEWNGIQCIALAQEPHCAGWLNAAAYTAKVIKTYSEDFGMYIYPKIIVADAQDGMEYPMITLDGGKDPEYRSLLAHEVGHNWFYGMVGNNETYRAFLDEGFTQFLTAWAMAKIDGEVVTDRPISNYVHYYKKDQYPRINNAYRGYMQDAIKSNDPPIDIHSDYYGSALGHGGGYRHVYMKTATMLYHLQYVLGDDLFIKAMQHYFNQWKVCHPYDDDFRESITEYVGTDLSWFFDQWITTSKQIDYGIKSVKKIGYGDYKITLIRKGEMQMPLDITIISKHGKENNYYIPNTHFQKQTTAKILPKWEGWDKLYKKYSFTVNMAEGIKDIIIDPTERLADIHPFDNHKKAKVDFTFDSKIGNPSEISTYEMRWRPDVWYNDLDGVKIGLHLNGNYMHYKRRLELTAWYNSRSVPGLNDITYESSNWKGRNDPFSFNLNYSSPMPRVFKNTIWHINLRYLDGYQMGLIGIYHTLKNNDKLHINIKSMYRKDKDASEYLMFKNHWIPDKYNNVLDIGYEHPYQYVKGNGIIKLGIRTVAPISDYNYQSLTAEVINTNTINKKYILRTRTYAQYILGDVAPESGLYAYGANTETLMENKYVRSSAFFNPKWTNIGAETNHFHYGGGLNLRGYAGYTIIQLDKQDSNFYFVWNPKGGIAENIELEFDGLFKFKPKILRNLKLNTYLFTDIGTMTYRNNKNNIRLADPRIDAGIGLALTIKKFGVLETVKPFTIRIDFPMFLNHPPATDIKYFNTSRFVIGINRAF